MCLLTERAPSAARALPQGRGANPQRPIYTPVPDVCAMKLVKKIALRRSSGRGGAGVRDQRGGGVTGGCGQAEVSSGRRLALLMQALRPWPAPHPSACCRDGCTGGGSSLYWRGGDDAQLLGTPIGGGPLAPVSRAAARAHAPPPRAHTLFPSLGIHRRLQGRGQGPHCQGPWHTQCTSNAAAAARAAESTDAWRQPQVGGGARAA